MGGTAVATRLLFRTARGPGRVFPFLAAGDGAMAGEPRMEGSTGASATGASRFFPFLAAGGGGAAGSREGAGAGMESRAATGKGSERRLWENRAVTSRKSPVPIGLWAIARSRADSASSGEAVSAVAAFNHALASLSRRRSPPTVERRRFESADRNSPARTSMSSRRSAR